MNLWTNTIAATFAAILIGGPSINPASAVPHESGRVHTGLHAGMDVQGANYVNPRSAPQGSQSIQKSNASGRTNGLQG